MANKRSKSSKEASPSWVRVVAAFAAGVLCTLVYTTQLHSQPPPLQRVNQGSNVVLASGGESSPKAEDEEVLSSVAPVTNTVVGGYRYGDKFKCDKTKLRHIVTPAEHTQGYLEPSSLLQLVETFRNCGVIALEGAIGLNDTAEFRSNLEKRLAPFLASRARVRDRFRSTMRRHGSLGVLASETLDELFFHSGDVFKERNDGRIDIELPMADPFNRSNITRNPFAAPVLRRLLGESAELKSLHAMFALSYLNGTRDQHWHRDTGLLFAADDAFHVTDDVHARNGGMHEPPYALNCFIALTNLTAGDGPTEFILGSHMWGVTWYDDEQDNCCEDYMFTNMPPGSIIISDYRTVHRGTINLGTNPRPVAMYIYGRDWWSDRINYGRSDYGGLKATSADAMRGLLSAEEAATLSGADLQLVAEAYLRTHQANDAAEELELRAKLTAAIKDPRPATTGTTSSTTDQGQDDVGEVDNEEGAGRDMLHDVLQQWRRDEALVEVKTTAARKKMFKGMLAKWGESLQSEVRGTVHRLPQQYALQRRQQQQQQQQQQVASPPTSGGGAETEL